MCVRFTFFLYYFPLDEVERRVIVEKLKEKDLFGIKALIKSLKQHFSNIELIKTIKPN